MKSFYCWISKCKIDRGPKKVLSLNWCLFCTLAEFYSLCSSSLYDCLDLNSSYLIFLNNDIIATVVTYPLCKWVKLLLKMLFWDLFIRHNKIQVLITIPVEYATTPEKWPDFILIWAAAIGSRPAISWGKFTLRFYMLHACQLFFFHYAGKIFSQVYYSNFLRVEVSHIYSGGARS